MDSFAILLTLASIVCLIVGLINPKSFYGIFKQNANRKFLSIFFGVLIIVLFVIFGVTTDNSLENTDPQITVSNEVQKTKVTTVPTQINVEDEIENLIKEQLTGNNNNEKPYLKDINLVMDQSKAVIVINYNADNNITSNLLKVSINSKMSDLYYKLYKSDLPIKSVSICANLPLTDKYGNESDDIIYTTLLKQTEAAKINWSNDESVIKNVTLPNVWSTLFMSPVLTVD